ncbi:unnamed protein product [Victoria cruziana]
MQWVAHGLIEQKKGIDVEKTGEKYVSFMRCLIEETQDGT